MPSSPILLKGMADVIILQVLDTNGDCYGYQLLERIRDASHDLFVFQEGTLYPLLYKMERDGLVTSERKTALNGKERRYYRITDSGKTKLAAKRGESKQFIDGLQAIFNWAAV